MKKNQARLLLVFSLVLTLILSTALMASANTVNITVNNAAEPLEATGQTGRVGWEQGENGVIEAIGIGLPPAGVGNFRQGQILARRAAVVDAYRNLAETLNGVHVDSETTMHNLAVADDIVKVRVSALVKGAKVVRENANADGSYQVVLSINMYGANSVAEVAINAIKPAEIQNFPPPSNDYKYQPAPQGGEYTGVIIDAKDMGLKSTFSPRVYDEDGNIVYGNKYIDPDFAIKHGMVEYLRDTNPAGSSRVGTRPIVAKAIRLADNNFNVVISNSDAQKILAAHNQSGFLANCAVAFVK